MKEPKHFLEMPGGHMLKSKAVKLVTDLLLKRGIKSPVGGWEKCEVILGEPPNEKRYTFREMVQCAMEKGIVNPFQTIIDHGDDFFGGRFGIGGIGVTKMSVTHQGYTQEFEGPCRVQPVEEEFASDILFFRKEACLYSDETDFEFCARYYRSYLVTCISLVDAFINRYITLQNYKNPNYSADFENLIMENNIEKKFSLLLKQLTGKELAEINKGTEWLHFQRLRTLRNNLIHANEPFIGHQIKDFAAHLNYVKEGIGGLLKKFRELQGKPALGFMERLHSAPLVVFRK